MPSLLTPSSGSGGLEPGDVVVVCQKAVSKAEGRVERVPPERHVEVILRESTCAQAARDFVISETRGGFVCASAGIDRSNAPGDDWVVLLPADPDASAGRVGPRSRPASGRRLR